MNTDERPPCTQQQIDAAATEVRRLEPDVRAARREAQGNSSAVLALQGTISYYHFLLKFRGVGRDYEYWPVGVILVTPFAVAGLLWVIACALNFSVLSASLTLLVGVLVTAAVCAHLLWRPPTKEIQHRLPELQNDLVAAEAIRQQSSARLQTLEAPYRLAKERQRNLTNELARYEAQQKRRQLEMERQTELERQRWLHSIEYQRQQLYERNWKALRSVEFEQFLEEVFLALGYQVETTKVTGDQGVDLIVSIDGRRIAIQVKGYYNSVSNSAIQEAHTGMAYHACQACAVVTNSRFTSAAKELAARVGCVLIDEDSMQAFIMGQFQL